MSAIDSLSLSTHPSDWVRISFENEWANRVSIGLFRAASVLTDPACESHEFYRRISLVDVLNPAASKAANLARKILLGTAAAGFAFAALFTSVPGIALRALAASLQAVPFSSMNGKAEDKILPADRKFTLLSWNVCCIGGGYSISDGGVLPWSFRLDAIIDKIIESDADVNCLNEVYDAESAHRICERLKENGYTRFYFNIGPRALGVSSGILVASKYEIEKPEFTPFPKETLLGRTQFTEKGIFSFDVSSRSKPFARIVATHLQHSEEPEFPTEAEVAARRKQMAIVVEKTNAVRDRCILVAGDLNLDDKEYESSPWKSQFVKGADFTEKTWGGDAYCARLVGKPVSGPLNLDYAFAVKGTAASIRTTLVRTGYDPETIKKEALSDHEGLLSEAILA